MESNLLGAVAPGFGLKVRGAWMFGRYKGYPVAVREGGVSESYRVVFQVVLVRSAIAGVSAALADKRRLASRGLKPAAVRIEPSASALAYVHTPKVRAKAKDVARILEALVAFAGIGGPPPGDRCEKCHTAVAGDVFLVDGIPIQLCAADRQAFRAQTEQRASVDVLT